MDLKEYEFGLKIIFKPSKINWHAKEKICIFSYISFQIILWIVLKIF